MKIKKIIAKDLKEGKQKVTLELGDDAVILSNRTIIDPKTNQEYYEIVAALDENPISKKNPLEKIVLPETQHHKSNNEDKMLDITSKIYDEINSLNNKLNNIYEDIRYTYLGVYPDEFKKFHNSLIENEISQEEAIRILSEIYKTYPGADIQAMKDEFKKVLSSQISFDKNIQKTKKQQIVILLGPTGSGKSLTLVKLAILSKLVLESSVLILSADSYKVSGIEQMQTYSSIADIPFYPIYDINDLKNILTKEYDRDIIFIDTIGKNQNDESNLKFSQDIITFCNATLIYLVLPANLTKKNYLGYYEHYKALKPDALILTKIDETKSIGQFYEAVKEIDLPIAYFANGQKAPENIEQASYNYFIELFFKKK
jgi:flagellar biosynthesis protein FlhF